MMNPQYVAAIERREADTLLNVEFSRMSPTEKLTWERYASCHRPSESLELARELTAARRV